MEKTIEFKIPEGYIFDKDNSTENVIRFKPIKKKITYKDICRELFLDKPSWKLTDSGTSIHAHCTSSAIIHHKTISTSWQQLDQLLALNKLMNVAKYLNGDWEPDFTNFNEQKPYIRYDFVDSKFYIGCSACYRYSAVYFKSEELALQAIEILGEDEIKKALGIFE